jgi:hypothetical protein
MKKNIIIGIFLLPAAVLVGCGCQNNQDQIKYQASSENKIQATNNQQDEEKIEEKKIQTNEIQAESLDIPSKILTIKKLYKDEEYKFRFTYNPAWTISSTNTGKEYDSSNPYILVNAGKTSDSPCENYGCPIRPGNREELSKGDTFESAPPLNPWFKILLVSGNDWVSVQLVDAEKKCIAEAACQQFLSSIPLDKKEKKDGAEYNTYNDFLDLISSLEITE